MTNVEEIVVSLYLSGLKQKKNITKIENTTYYNYSLIDRFRKRGSVENIPRKEKQLKRKGKQQQFDDRDTRKILMSIKIKQKKKFVE